MVDHNDALPGDQSAPAVNQRLRDILYQQDPYDGFPIEEFVSDDQGWGSKLPVYGALIDLVRPRRILEVGTWKGGSAITMATHCRKRQLDTEIVCIDTWLGSNEHVVTRRDQSRDLLQRRHGYPQLYFTFMRNVIDAGVQSMITPLPQDSLGAARLLTRLGITADLIYIDASHDEESARRDIDAYWPLLVDDGVLFGHDYGQKWPGVISAVDAFAATIGQSPLVWKTHWILAKSAETDLSTVRRAINAYNAARFQHQASQANAPQSLDAAGKRVLTLVQQRRRAARVAKRQEARRAASSKLTGQDSTS